MPREKIYPRTLGGRSRAMAEWEKQIFAINLVVGDVA
jgi:hypothetical protein